MQCNYKEVVLRGDKKAVYRFERYAMHTPEKLAKSAKFIFLLLYMSDFLHQEI